MMRSKKRSVITPFKNTYDPGIDMSPEATADRIVSLSTAFFSSYHEQHPELSQKKAITKFINIISGGINTGFGEARNILSRLNVLDGDIATNIDLSYALVQEKTNCFLLTALMHHHNNAPYK